MTIRILGIDQTTGQERVNSPREPVAADNITSITTASGQANSLVLKGGNSSPGNGGDVQITGGIGDAGGGISLNGGEGNTSTGGPSTLLGV